MAEHGYVPLEDHIADSDSWWKAIESISRLIISMIENRKLELEPVRISEKVDKNSGKMNPHFSSALTTLPCIPAWKYGREG